VLADRLADAGLKLAVPGEATRARLAAALPQGQPPLPFDAGALRNGFAASETGALLQALTDDAAVGALVYLMTTQPQSEQVADEIVSLAGRAGKPVLLVLTAGSVADKLRARLRQSGVEGAVVHDAEAAIAAAERFGWPVVAKALVSNLAHKSDRGGVRLVAAALGPRLAELDINPLILRTEGAIAVDVRARLGRAPHGDSA
jgi:acyl-CoA synthetase (NDP forming)